MNAQQTIPISQFARAMLEADEDFASRVASFEERFGAADTGTLGLLAGAAYFCDVHCDHPTNLLAICKAIGEEGSAPSMYHCGQVSAEQWDRLHEFVIAGQMWRGVAGDIPDQLNLRRIDSIVASLGSADAGREPLVSLFVGRLVGSVLELVWSKLGSSRGEEAYTDYSAWYAGPTGGHDSAQAIEKLARECRSTLGDTLPGGADAANELVDGILADGPPACVCKFTRYLAIQAASIGALTWRGNLPAIDERTSLLAGDFLAQAKAALAAWRDGLPQVSEIGSELCDLLGPVTDRKLAIVFEMLNIYELPGQRDCSEAACDWLADVNADQAWHARTMFAR